MTDAEIELLDDFLISGAVHDDSMDVSMMDGFITAVASGPNMLMPSAMLPWIWDAEHGKNAPRFASTSEARRITGLILRHWNDVNDSLNQTPDAYEPLLPEREVEGNTLSIIDEWCEGYCKGIEIDREAWDPLIASHPEWFTVIMLYGTPDGWAELERQRYSLEQHQAFALSLADSVSHIHQYWVGQRRQQIARGEMPGVIAASQSRRREPKIGRNDPCPCGSGRKYKRCHGSGAVMDDFRSGFPPDPVEPDTGGPPFVLSSLSQRVARDGTAVEIEIYENGEGGWLLEIVDEFGNSTVWDKSFPTDHAALAEALKTIDTEGIAAVMGSAPASATKH
ncbi:UPF0149 family protein [Paraburkholderia humisilvae]|uniref:UPF0149 family protein n=1 Tax=Paraburkholderia humisilvae TaxID=627669 RepID=UPI001FE9A041|nr:UPF0149 family protein [Paraburkholderia humisilvae]